MSNVSVDRSRLKIPAGFKPCIERLEADRNAPGGATMQLILRGMHDYLARHGCGHCFGCEFLDAQQQTEVYASIICAHPATMAKYQDLLDHDPSSECPAGRIKESVCTKS